MIVNEQERIGEVHKYLSLDLSQSTQLQDIVDLAAQLCGKPIALLTLLDEEVNWLRVRSGVDVELMPRNTSFCQHTIGQDQVLVIQDASLDSRFDDNPLVHHEPNIRFYAGAPLLLTNGFKLGSLCVFDLEPGDINPLQQRTLRTLASQAVALLELELSKVQLAQQIREIRAKNEALSKIAVMQSHDIRQPLTSIMGLLFLVKEDLQSADKQWLDMMTEATDALDASIRAIVNESISERDLKAIRFSRLVEEIEDYAILLLDREGNIENWNKGAQLMKGYRGSEVIGKNFRLFYTQEDRRNNRPEKLIAHAISEGRSRDEGWRVRRDGTRFWGSIVITAIHNEKNEVIGFTKVTRNLSDKLEHALEASLASPPQAN